ncbi:MAG TPA: bifunctional oligoribonuclease/PAP phosphatase NrnA [Bacilli bacterium]|jgi:phosphoesterase RecJ-like protein|nr:bifunctional oligoribonuclease/PAP phosphatase NrnA [Acholeplasmataceae bacterium]HNZ78359.1 bifunctional oligoribonuclease/PAP phosphatase NrnA [Bacilli bacterium]HOD61058.1 bifunctional oligoribonuclease/PAP phosphatase NrnA [Bacilli bacterium]HOH60914.1 bifunctional oligoribonuclease/PAP phosphatase NrnA [Bacilli bacterium]HPB48747.1 bifunctional oligoribonuclease/PAP phosphatase NrnA [Bacilli bacterium]
MFNKVLKAIKEHDTIIIQRHLRPDGDALGSQIGLKEAIKATFPRKKVFAVGDQTERYNFIGEMDVIEDKLYKDALVFILDTSEAFMISDDRYKMAKYIIKIDHHIYKESYGDIAIVDTEYESCAGLVADIIFKMKLKMTESAAKALYTGIVTDSGRFRYESTTSRTFLTAAKLLETKFNMTEVYNNLYSDDLETVRLRANFVLRFQLTKNNVAYIKTTKEDLKNLGIDFYSVSRTMVNTMAGIKGIDIWVNFTEDEENNVVVAEIRSNKYNINTIATKYGGGGHKGASGASLKSFEEADQMLEDLDNLILEENYGK